MKIGDKVKIKGWHDFEGAEGVINKIDHKCGYAVIEVNMFDDKADIAVKLSNLELEEDGIEESSREKQTKGAKFQVHDLVFRQESIQTIEKPIVGNKYNLCIDGCLDEFIEVEIIGYGHGGNVFFKYEDGSIGSSNNLYHFLRKKQKRKFKMSDLLAHIPSGAKDLRFIEYKENGYVYAIGFPVMTRTHRCLYTMQNPEYIAPENQFILQGEYEKQQKPQVGDEVVLKAKITRVIDNARHPYSIEFDERSSRLLNSEIKHDEGNRYTETLSKTAKRSDLKG